MPAKPQPTDTRTPHEPPAPPAAAEPEPTFAARILREEAAAIAGLTPLEPAFFEAAGLIEQCARSGGSVLVTGLGKSGLIGAKIAATFSSLGIPAHAVHPTEAVHGDLGRFRPCDTVLALSFSGETDEVVNLAAILRQDGLPIISITGGRGPEVRGQRSEVRGQESGVRGQESAEGSPGAQAPGGWTPDAHQTPEVGGQTPPTPERKLGVQPRRGDQSLAPGAGSAATQPGESRRSYSAEPRRGEGTSRPAIGAVNNHTSSLERLATAALHLNLSTEAGAPDFAAPTSSTTATLALGDTLGLCVARRLGLTDADFRKRHPGGALGGLLRPITEALRYRAGENLPAARASETVAEALAHAATIGRRPGAIVVVEDGPGGEPRGGGKLAGIFTDGDLRRLILRDPSEMQRPIGEVMTRSPRTLPHTALVRDAVRMVREFRQDEIPIVDEAGRPVGVLDVQDLVALRLVTE